MQRRHHDMGGRPAGPVEQQECHHAPWEKKVDAIMRALVAARLITVDELRRGIEEIGPGAYDELGYYERWITSITNLMLEKRILTPREIGRAIERVRERHAGA